MFTSVIWVETKYQVFSEGQKEGEEFQEVTPK